MLNNLQLLFSSQWFRKLVFLYRMLVRLKILVFSKVLVNKVFLVFLWFLAVRQPAQMLFKLVFQLVKPVKINLV